jgi:hypothetical protein
MVLRLLILKHIRNWSYEVLEREVRANGFGMGSEAESAINYSTPLMSGPGVDRF